MKLPVCTIIAGPSGAGKTTFALTYLPETALCRNFVNADLIASGLWPLSPERGLLAASPRSISNLLNDYSLICSSTVCLDNSGSTPTVTCA